jgi:hypothetical protein
VRGATDQIRDSVADSDGVRIIQRAAKAINNREFARRLFLFSPFWIRSPQTSFQDNPLPLVAHLFVHYPIPEFLYAAWTEQHRDHLYSNFLHDNWKWLCWTVILGQGGSLKRAGREFDWNIPDKFQHHLSFVRSSVPPIQACIEAEVRRLGGRESDCDRIISHPAFAVDPTERSAQNGFEDFWRATVRWLVTNHDALTDEEATLVLDWACHENTEANRGCWAGREFSLDWLLCHENSEANRAVRKFSWRGRSPRRVIESAREYQEYLHAPSGPFQDRTWSSHDMDWAFEGGSESWSFVELTSTKELRAEGISMQHCVASYDGRCVSGFSAIVSVRCSAEHRVTIEVNPRSSAIVQACGPRNCRPSDAEIQVIRRWEQDVLAPLRRTGD